MTATEDTSDTERAIRALVGVGDVCELRAICDDRGRQSILFGYFDELPALLNEARRASSTTQNAIGVYVTLNPVNPALLSRCKNRMKRANKGDTTGDQHILRRTRLLIDIDASPASGISTTDEEHESAIALARKIEVVLTETGWPKPMLCDSGNGAHLVYAIDLPRDDEGLVGRVLEAAQQLWGGDELANSSKLKIDTSNKNPARITKLYGTPTRKGDNTKERPHRRSRVLEVPTSLDVVTREQLEQLALIIVKSDRPSASRSADWTSRDYDGVSFIETFLSKHGIDAKRSIGNDGSQIWILEVCPFNADHHRGEAHVGVRANGMIGAECKHDSCRWGWKDLRAKFEPLPNERFVNYETRQRQTDQHPNAPTSTENERPAAPPVSILAVDVARLDIPPIRSYPTGNDQLDELLAGGVNTRELLVVLGPPGGCKTAYAISTAVHLQENVPVLYASTELEQHELMARIASNIRQWTWAAVRRGHIERDRVVLALDGLQIRLIGCDRLPRDGAAALQLIEDETAWMAKEYGIPPIVIVDYLQDLARGSERDVRTKIGDHATVLRAMSQRQDCAMIAVSSVARTFYSPKRAEELRAADDASIYLAAAKESGDVDYAAARVLFLDAEDDREKKERDVRIAVAKSRDGRVGFAGARVESACGRFTYAPDVLEAMAATGRVQKEHVDTSAQDDDLAFKVVLRMYAAGEGNLCTLSQLKNSAPGISKDRMVNALDRLVHAKRLRTVEIDREEGGKKKKREVFQQFLASRATDDDAIRKC